MISHCKNFVTSLDTLTITSSNFEIDMPEKAEIVPPNELSLEHIGTLLVICNQEHAYESILDPKQQFLVCVQYYNAKYCLL